MRGFLFTMMPYSMTTLYVIGRMRVCGIMLQDCFKLCDEILIHPHKPKNIIFYKLIRAGMFGYGVEDVVIHRHSESFAPQFFYSSRQMIAISTGRYTYFK